MKLVLPAQGHPFGRWQLEAQGERGSLPPGCDRSIALSNIVHGRKFNRHQQCNDKWSSKSADGAVWRRWKIEFKEDNFDITQSIDFGLMFQNFGSTCLFPENIIQVKNGLVNVNALQIFNASLRYVSCIINTLYENSVLHYVTCIVDAMFENFV